MKCCLCCECGKGFEPDEAKHYTEYHGFTDGRGEKFVCCPFCGGGFDDAETCVECEQPNLKLYADRWCAECLREMITVKNFVEFLRADTLSPSTWHILEDFVFYEVWNWEADFDVNVNISNKMKRDLLSVVKRNLAVNPNFIEKCRDYIMEDIDIAEEFAKWLVKSETVGGEC